MKPYGLNSRQKELLQALVKFSREGKLREPIVPIPFGNPTGFAIHIRGEASFRFKYISDLDTLCDRGLMSFRWNRQGTGKLYYLSKAAETAVAGDFAPPTSPLDQEITLNEVVQMMSGGTLTIEGLDACGSKEQLARDPIARHTAVELLIDSLTRTVTPGLPWEASSEYEKATRQLKEMLLGARINQAEVKTLTRTLALLGDIEGDMAVMLEAWTHLYALLLIGTTRSSG